MTLMLLVINSRAEGIVVGGTNTATVTERDGSVFAYNTSGTNVPSNNFDLAGVNIYAEGIAYANNRWWVVDSDDNKVYGYDSNGDQVDEHDFHSSNSDAKGIFYFDSKYWIVDSGDNKVYVYNTSWDRVSGDEFNFISANANASGIAIVADIEITSEEEQDIGKVFAYSLSGSYNSSNTF